MRIKGLCSCLGIQCLSIALSFPQDFTHRKDDLTITITIPIYTSVRAKSNYPIDFEPRSARSECYCRLQRETIGYEDIFQLCAGGHCHKPREFCSLPLTIHNFPSYHVNFFFFFMAYIVSVWQFCKMLTNRNTDDFAIFNAVSCFQLLPVQGCK